MDQNLPGTSGSHEAQADARRTECDQRIQDSPTRRRIAPPSGFSGPGPGPGPGPAPPPPPLRYQNLPAHLAQQLAALPSLQPIRGYSLGRGRGATAPAPAPAPALFNQYGHLPAHLQQQLALLPRLPAPAPHGRGQSLPMATSIVCIIIYYT